MNISRTASQIIFAGFAALFFATPLILSSASYELFEYNKMMFAYAITALITGAWIARMIIEKKILITQTPLSLPFSLFLLTQIASTVISIDPHVSIWGYYSRFHGGLLSTISYFLLFHAFVANVKKEQLKKLAQVTFSSALIVTLYGIAEHYGIDKDYWVQDVQRRVFSTLGQPNWLAAYLSILLPISVSFALLFQHGKEKFGSEFRILNLEFRMKNSILLYLVPILFYTCLLFTKSRSGFLGFWIANIVFWLLFFVHLYTSLQTKRGNLMNDKMTQPFFRSFLILNSAFLILTFFFQSPFPIYNKFATIDVFQSFSRAEKAPEPENSSGTVLETGITESGDIRKIVWKGAFDIVRNHTLLGTGVETFAYAYYKFRPVEHNMTSEWEFLYNKAHNEYLNFAATTGLLGLGSYILFIGGFTGWFLKRFFEMRYEKWDDVRNSDSLKKSKRQNISPQIPTSHFPLLISLFSGWISILITNFFGFSVVVIALAFFLIPAISYQLSVVSSQKRIDEANKPTNLSVSQKLALLTIACLLLTIGYYLLNFWFADKTFATGYRYARSGYYTDGYPYLKQATEMRPGEPFYHDERAYAAAILARSAFDENDATTSAQFAQESIEESQKALTISRQNVTFWKTRSRILFTLSALDPLFIQNALEASLVAQEFAPTDPKISYNVGILYGRLGQTDKAIEELKKTTEMKIDFRDAYYAQALFYKDRKQNDQAREQLEFILNKLNPQDVEAKQLLEEL